MPDDCKMRLTIGPCPLLFPRHRHFVAIFFAVVAKARHFLKWRFFDLVSSCRSQPRIALSDQGAIDKMNTG